MFKHEGPARNPRNNALLAGYLAFVAGFVNSGGFVLIGSLTSHVTGSVGRMSTDLSAGHFGSALFAFILVTTFFLGAFLASLTLEASSFGRTGTAYGVALILEGVLLSSFVLIAGLFRTTHLRILDLQAAILCTAMGMQNSLVTRLSGAVVRTTHLTGVVTDLGIEAARWLRWYRSKSPAARPLVLHVILLSVIISAFTLGAVLGAVATVRAHHWAMLVPAGAIWLAALYAFIDRH
jgi:uncharacterized membrane protein YoaK (UPF0700 family)